MDTDTDKQMDTQMKTDIEGHTEKCRQTQADRQTHRWTNKSHRWTQMNMQMNTQTDMQTQMGIDEHTDGHRQTCRWTLTDTEPSSLQGSPENGGGCACLSPDPVSAALTALGHSGALDLQALGNPKAGIPASLLLNSLHPTPTQTHLPAAPANTPGHAPASCGPHIRR